MNDMRTGCENCTKCFNDCPTPFPEEFINGGAENCEKFNEEVNPEVVLANMERQIREIKDKNAEKGIYL